MPTAGYASAVQSAHRLRGKTPNDEIYTADWLLDAARHVLGGFDLDPASSAAANRNVNAAVWWNAEDKPLDRDWRGRVWMNPPFSMKRPFFTKLLSEADAGSVTAWAAIMPFEWSAMMCRRTCFAAERVVLLNNQCASYRLPDGERHGGGLHAPMVAFGGNGLRAERVESAHWPPKTHAAMLTRDAIVPVTDSGLLQ